MATTELRDVLPQALIHPRDWKDSASHISGLPEGTTLKVWRNGKMQIAILHRIIPNGEIWNICQPPRWAGAEPAYIYSEGFRYIIEHSF